MVDDVRRVDEVPAGYTAAAASASPPVISCLLPQPESVPRAAVAARIR